MKHKIIYLTTITLLSIFSFYGCVAGGTWPNASSTTEFSLPALVLTETEETEHLLPETKDTFDGVIPELADATLLAEQLSHGDTMKLWVKEYYASYSVEDEKNESFVVNSAILEENALGAEIVNVTMDDVCTTIYRVPFRERLLLSYDLPRESCYVKASWVTNEVFASAQGSGIQTVECSLSGVRLTGENMEYTIKYYLDNEDQAILKVTGRGENAVCLMRMEDGFRFYCENGATMELPDFYEEKAVQSLDIPAGQVGVLEGISKGYLAELYTEAFSK